MSKKWNRFLEITVAYGYKPWQALVGVIFFYFLGAGVFDLGFSFGLMSPADSRVFLHEDFVTSPDIWLPPAWLPPEYPSCPA